MSKYTTEVRYFCETYANATDVGSNSIDKIVDSARTTIFNFNYPIFDEAYKPVLERKILKHYYTREIAAETYGLWQIWLNTRLNEIMPYYNQLYKSELIEFNPLYDVDMTTDYKLNKEQNDTTKENSSTTKNNSGSESSEYSSSEKNENDSSTQGSNKSDNVNKETNKYSDTPQGALTNVENDTYLTNARVIDTKQDNLSTTSEQNTSSGSSSANGDSERSFSNKETASDNKDRTNNMKSLDDYVQHVKGKSAGESMSKRVKEFRETFLNIDVMIINDLSDLFFNLW